MSEDAGWGDLEETPKADLEMKAILDTLEAIADRQNNQAVELEGQQERHGELESVVKELADLVQSLVKQKKDRRPRRYRFEALDDKGKLDLWVELAAFVDYLNSIFGTSAKHTKQKWRIPDWWWKQPIVVYELLALKASHDEAYTSTTPEAPTTEMIAWLDRWFWPCMNRIFNESWGLEVQPAPDMPSSKFSLKDANNDRGEFDAFLVGQFGSSVPADDSAEDQPKKQAQDTEKGETP